MKIKSIIEWNIPYYGNKENEPYGKILVEHDGKLKIIKFKNGTFIYKKKKYEIKNTGCLYNPNLIIQQ